MTSTFNLNNRTDVPLADTLTFFGVYETIQDFRSVEIYVDTDQPGVLTTDFSEDATTSNFTKTYAVAANTSFLLNTKNLESYFKLSFWNNSGFNIKQL